MTREEIIEKGEKELQFYVDTLDSEDFTEQIIESYKIKGVAKLDMLFSILDEEWDRYDYWFDKIFYHGCV